MYYIETILPLSLNQTFTYEVTIDEYDYIQIGCRVAVPFGKTKVYTGIVVDKHKKSILSFEPKQIDQIIDEYPIISEVQIKHWTWISNYYLSSIGEVYRAALPSSMLLASETVLKKKENIELDLNTLSDEEYILYEALQNQSDIKISEVTKIINKKNALAFVKNMLEKEVFEIEERIEELYKPKLVKYLRLHADFSEEVGLEKIIDSVKNAPKQKELVLGYFKLKALNKGGEVKATTLLSSLDVKSSVLKALVGKNIFEEYYNKVNRVCFHNGDDLQPIQLADFQVEACEAIKNQLAIKSVCLLHGITASGKTHIYAQLIQDTINQGKQVMVLVPEAVLTTQLLRKYQPYFGATIAVYNSKYSNNERVEIWNSIKSNKVKVIIGTRSAVFLPVVNLGLVIIDEEHEVNYKQANPSPRFHARDTAIVLAHLMGAKVVLGSATPSMESYYNVKVGKYGIVEVNQKYLSFPDPIIRLIDLKDKYKRKLMTGHFSDSLLESITERLEAGEQVILFQNRRGFAPVLECETCGHVPQCTQCNVSLTFHKNKNQLRCHYCGFSTAKPTRCNSCSSLEIITKGFGTEQIELEVKELFPDARVARMDADTTRGKYAFDKILDALHANEIDILIGTQMLAKGLDIKNITLVGVLNADQMLYYPDFRSHEKTFQLLVQVSGRSGRSEKKGEVLLQTYDVKHPVIVNSKERDYSTLYENQAIERKEYNYPPFSKIIKIVFKHKDYEKVKSSSLWYSKVLVQHIKAMVFGPEEPSINRIRNQYIRQLQIKIPEKMSHVEAKRVIRTTQKSFESIGQFKGVKVVVDVDYQ